MDSGLSSRQAAELYTLSCARIADLQKLVTEVRRFRTEQGIPDIRRVAARVTGLDIPTSEAGLRSMTRLDLPGAGFAPTAVLEVDLAGGAVSVELDTSAAIDVAAERARLQRDLDAAQKELDVTERKLADSQFAEKAPTSVVEKVRARRAVAVADAARVTDQLARLAGND
jgi:valyl-tRNA synthetase